MLNVDNARLHYGAAEALRGVTLKADAGRITCVLGRNGVGKTSLMRAIVGVQIVKSGSVIVLGQSAGSAALRRNVGYLTQSPSVYPDLTVRENVRYFASQPRSRSRWSLAPARFVGRGCK
jgi:ABC-2 type transport system ATP-binding protein